MLEVASAFLDGVAIEAAGDFGFEFGDRPFVRLAKRSLELADGKQKGQDMLGIYELAGDKLKVACVVGQWKAQEWSGKKRPTTFQLGNADVVIELQRVREK